ncbi:MAG: signal peptidase II [Gammaproteobacteria bacterium]|nr:signal peptidase II [Gammaproteobacteria bacterium]
MKSPMMKWLWLSLLVIVLDQITKSMASSMLEYARPVSILPLFNFTLLHNTGAAFSFLDSAGGWQRWFFTVIALGVSFFLVLWVRKLSTEEKLQAISLTLILGGAIGNVIDRIRFGYVVDFLDFYYGTSHFPAFNIADSAITIGAILIIYDSLFVSGRKTSELKADK